CGRDVMQKTMAKGQLRSVSLKFKRRRLKYMQDMLVMQKAPERKAGVLGKIGSSATQEYPSLIQTFFDTHTVGGVFLRDEDQRLYSIDDNDKNLSEIQLDHERVYRLVVVVVKVVHECRHLIEDYRKMVKEIKNGHVEEMEKLEWWFEQDIDDEGKENEEDEDGGEV
nr:hypothetical protein [Tanacetum cinerariifolium]